jgi:carbamoyl-phosphate synthase large subunit
MQLKFLITGCHGDLAFSIAQIIKKNFKNSTLIGTDLEKNGMGNLIFDQIYRVPPTSNKNYLKIISKLSKSVNLLIPSSEKEIVFFSKNEKKFKSKILINDKKIIDLFSNKLKTQKFLKKNFKNFSLNFSSQLSEIKKSKMSLPFFLKKKSGSGNQNYRIIKNKSDLKELKLYKQNEWVIEELLNKNSDEYTCAIIRIKDLKKIIIFNRKLHKLGHTMFADQFEDKAIETDLLTIADKINLNGVINIQFKIQDNQIKIFDINPRISSTVKMRDLLGFKDCLWWIKKKLKISNKERIKIKKNKSIVKFFQEKIID